MSRRRYVFIRKDNGTVSGEMLGTSRRNALGKFAKSLQNKEVKQINFPDFDVDYWKDMAEDEIINTLNNEYEMPTKNKLDKSDYNVKNGRMVFNSFIENKQMCEESGGVWVNSYVTGAGRKYEIVQGYCRKRVM